ncbi:sigma-70 family RNA polymerase sigma factor [Kribbella sp. NPDC051952]|uniref:RNA polymerase sigma factor n=1 Tax=Kribbella sp. NPDC051952 TaxID=3154851 RepID=UPI00341F38B2
MVIGLGAEQPDSVVAATDLALWERASAGDEEAFGQLYDRHARAVFNFLHRRTASWADAEDLTSAVFLLAWRRRAELVLDRNSILPWLLGVADRTARTAWRSKFRYRRSLSTLKNLAADEQDHADDVAERVDRDVQLRKVRDQLTRLPRHEQEIVELCVWAGLDQQAAAIALNIPLGTVKSRLYRARQHLRELLAPNSEEER